MPTVVVNGANEVKIDDVSVGNISDAILNNRDLAGAIYDAITAYEASLRQATIDGVAAKQELLDAANEQIAALEAQLKALGDQSAADLQAARDSFNQALAAAQATVADCQQRTKIAVDLQVAHTNLSQVLMNQGTSEAAIAAVQEVNRCQQAKDRIELQARLAAMPAE